MNAYRKSKELEIGGISFGATSGVVTTLGVVMGLGMADSSKVAITVSILIMAFCDSLSDALGVRMSEESKLDESPHLVFLASLFTFIGKLLFSIIFLIPILLLPSDQAIYTSAIFGCFILSVVSILIAKRKKISVTKELIENLSLVGIVLLVSFVLGRFASGIK